MLGTDVALCMSCDHAPICMYRANSSRTMSRCEYFRQKSNSPPGSQHNEFGYGNKLQSSNGFLGLCSSCENRQQCTFQKAKDGVWHCEEYE
jgi:hypothetical protein